MASYATIVVFIFLIVVIFRIDCMTIIIRILHLFAEVMAQFLSCSIHNFVHNVN